ISVCCELFTQAISLVRITGSVHSSPLLPSSLPLWEYVFNITSDVKKKKSNQFGDDDDLSDTDSGSTVSEKTKQNVLPVFTQKRQQILPGATLKPRKHPPWYSTRILEEERPDLAGMDGKLNLEREEAALMDMFIRGKSDLQTGDLIITDDK
ncbi:hypothetical protein GCK32_013663, partial [Trichostrongylus colubriformis]